jgi:hypothetical protein
VGIAIWVNATIVNAAETAVPSTSAGAMVGAASGAQAVSATVSASRMSNIFFVIFSPFICLTNLVHYQSYALCHRFNVQKEPEVGRVTLFQLDLCTF